MAFTLEDAKQQVLWGCQTMCGRGYVLGTAGNISARAEGGLFVITPTSLPYDELRPQDLVVGDMHGNIVEGVRKPSIEFGMHLAVLRNRPDVHCVVHTHSKFATAAGCTVGVDSVPAMDIEAAGYLGGDIPVAPFGPPGSDELAANVAASIGQLAGLILESHGAMGVGRTMREAMIACDNVERTCEMYMAVRAVGAVKKLPEPFLREWLEKSLRDRGVAD